MAVRNSLLEVFPADFDAAGKYSPVFRQHKMLSLPTFGHFLARKMAAGESASPSGTLLVFSSETATAFLSCSETQTITGQVRNLAGSKVRVNPPPTIMHIATFMHRNRRRRTNVQQLTCNIDLSSSFYYLFFSFVLIELKPFVLKGKVLGEKF